MAKKLSILGWVGSFLIAIALINWGLFYWFGYNILVTLSLGMRWLEVVLASIVAVLGLFAFGELVIKLFKK